MFNVTLGIYENMRPQSEPVSRATAEKPSTAQDFQSILDSVESHRAPQRADQVESRTVKAPAAEPLKKMPTVAQHQYEPLPEGCKTPESSWFIHAYYCEASGPATSASHPNWEAADLGQTIGGHGDTDGMGNPLTWSSPMRETLAAGEVFETPAGNYQVVTNRYGDLVLRPLDNAWRGGGEYFRSLTVADHHIGVHPQTGEVWYQGRA